MAKLTRILQKVFGVNAGTDERAQIGSFAAGAPAFTTDLNTMQSLANYGQGLFGVCVGENSPALEDLNSLYYLMTRQLAYLMQAGVAEYDSGTSYYIGSIVNVSGVTYVSLTDDNLSNPVTDVTKWKVQAGNNFPANLINGKVVPLFGITSTAFTRNANFTSTPIPAKVRVSRDARFIYYTDNATGAGLKVIDFNPKKINTTSAMTISAQPAGVSYALAESPCERFLAVGSDTTPFVHFYERVGSTLTKLADPATLPTAGSVFVENATWSPDGNLVAFCGNNGAKLVIYRKDGKTLVKVADPATMPANTTRDIKFSPDGKFLALLSQSPGVIYIYKITYDAAGLPVFTLVSNSITVALSNPSSIDWHPSSSVLFLADLTVRVFSIDSTSGVLTEVTQTGMPSVGAHAINTLKCTPDGKGLYTFSSIVSGSVVGILSYNTATKQCTVLGTFVSSGASSSASYIPSVTPSNKQLVVTRIDGSVYNIDMFENPEVLDVTNKTPQILYRVGVNQ